MKDIFYTIAERSARTRTDFPPIGGICVLNPDNDDDAEDGQVAEDYSLLGMRDHGDSYWVWETGEMVVTRWMPDVECVYSLSDIMFMFIDTSQNWTLQTRRRV